MLQELGALDPESMDYKLGEPVLELQDQAEAKANVDKRLDFIRGNACQPRLTTYMSMSVDSSLE